MPRVTKNIEYNNYFSVLNWPTYTSDVNLTEHILVFGRKRNSNPGCAVTKSRKSCGMPK